MNWNNLQTKNPRGIDAETIGDRINQAIAIQNPTQKRKALEAIKWILRTRDGQFVQLSKHGLFASLTGDISKAAVYDGCDNEQHKARFFSAVLKTPVYPELL